MCVDRALWIGVGVRPHIPRPSAAHVPHPDLSYAPGMDRVALISDIHGNLSALEAVLADIDARGITRIVNLGDTVGKGPRGRECIERVQQRCETNLLGNWDDLLSVVRAGESDESRWWREQLAPGQAEWLGALPFSHDFVMSGRTIRAFHASATSAYLKVYFDHTGVEFAGMFQNTAATGDGPLPTVVAYGDLHDPFVETDHGLTLVNVGSVGNSLGGDSTPHYVILEGTYGEDSPAPFTISFVRVPYDVQSELAIAERLAAPRLEAYRSELTNGVWRGHAGVPGQPAYHRAPVVEIDDKDWTWTIEQRCPDCGFDPASVDVADLPDLVRRATDPWAQVVARPTARRRPSPATWSPIEYAAHVRDVCAVMASRVDLMLDQDAPTLPNWDQDEAAVLGRYERTDPRIVIRELLAARDRLNASFERVQDDEWSRTGLRSNGSEFSVRTLGRYAVHDLIHHLHDVDEPY